MEKRNIVKLSIPQWKLHNNAKRNHDYQVEDVEILNSQRKRKINVVYGYRKISRKEKGVFFKYPYLELYWDFEKNKGINPLEVYANSDLYVWWTCRLNHSNWLKVKNRIKTVDCPTCIKMTTPISGSLLEKYPQIAKEWDYEKNYPLLPSAIKPCKREKVWWICSAKGHSYSASPDNRVGKGSGCKRCASSKPRKKRKQISLNELQNVPT